MTTTLIQVSAVVLRDPAGRVLLVRKRGTSRWMRPGGKPEAGENGAECGAREVAEELGIVLDPRRLQFLGELSAPAANEPDHTVVAQSFLWPDPINPDVRPAAEIEAARWVELDGPADPSLAPLYVDVIAPLLSRY